MTVAGEGPARARLETQSRQLGLEVSFRGWVQSGARQRLLAETDLLAVPSVWPEGLGMAGFEAVAASVAPMPNNKDRSRRVLNKAAIRPTPRPQAQITAQVLMIIR